MARNCKVSDRQVKWSISANEIDNEITPLLKKGLPEYSGTLVFKDYNCRNGLCDKTLKEIQKSGDSGVDSVATPLAYVNYHTHPKSCYLSEDVKWGWPSGEDCRVCLEFANNKNLAHIVFTIEGAYVINCLKVPQKNTWFFIEEVLKLTHKFRSNGNDREIVSEFNKELLNPLGIYNRWPNAKEQWLDFVNILTPNMAKFLCSLYKLPKTKKDKKNVKIMTEDGDNRLFDIKFVPRGKDITFSQGYINQSCKLRS
jgi:hypothetical protein